MARALSDAGISMAFCVAQTVGRKFTAVDWVLEEEDAAKRQRSYQRLRKRRRNNNACGGQAAEPFGHRPVQPVGQPRQCERARDQQEVSAQYCGQEADFPQRASERKRDPVEEQRLVKEVASGETTSRHLDEPQRS